MKDYLRNLGIKLQDKIQKIYIKREKSGHVKRIYLIQWMQKIAQWFLVLGNYKKNVFKSVYN